jgi:hypothetical protein
LLGGADLRPTKPPCLTLDVAPVDAGTNPALEEQLNDLLTIGSSDLEPPREDARMRLDSPA